VAAEEIDEEIHGPWSSDRVRKLAAELDAWADLFDAHGLSTGAVARADA
jgi:hypothetical protein